MIESQISQVKTIRISKIKLFKKHYRLFFLWAVHYFAYFGFPLLIGGGTKLVLNFTLLGSTELLGILLSAKLLRHFNYVSSMRFFVFCCLVTCILFYFFDKYFFLLIISKFFLTLFFGVLQIYTLEVFHTQIRSQGFGYCFTFGRLSAIFIPLFLGRFNAIEINPVLLPAMFFFLSLIFMIGLKET